MIGHNLLSSASGICAKRRVKSGIILSLSICRCFKGDCQPADLPRSACLIFQGKEYRAFIFLLLLLLSRVPPWFTVWSAIFVQGIDIGCLSPVLHLTTPLAHQFRDGDEGEALT